MKKNLILMLFTLFPSLVPAGDNGITISKVTISTDGQFRIPSHPSPPRPVNEVLRDSVFDKDQPPESILEGQITHYHPMSLAIISSLYSRLPERDDDQYAQVNLPALENSEICPNPMKAFVKLSKQDHPHTFIVLPGAYATWKRGSFNNQTIVVLDKHFNDPNIIAFAGYLSPPFLEGVCNKIPWDSISIAKDIYSRLGIYLDEIQANPSSTGLIGFSGGGGLATVMLSEDSSMKEKRHFGLGGAVFSPTLHGRTIFHNLDAAKEPIDHSRALTKVTDEDGFLWLDWGSLLFFVSAHLNNLEIDWKDSINAYEDGPKDFLERAINEFTVIDLKDTLTAVGFNIDNVDGEFNYYNAYINTGYKSALLDKCIKSSLYSPIPDCLLLTINQGYLNYSYDNKTNLTPFLATIDKPFLIYFSQDDPVLSSYDNSGQPKVITEILDDAKNNPYITVFNPQYGGHIGIFLDPIFEELVKSFFSRPDKQLTKK